MEINGDWNTKEMFRLYMFNHLNNMHKTAEDFKRETRLNTDREITLEGDFLKKWWKKNYDILHHLLQTRQQQDASTQALVLTQRKGDLMTSNDNQTICVKNVEWDPKAALDVYIYHHLKKRNMHETAEIFQIQANVNVDESGVVLWCSICCINLVSCSTISLSSLNDKHAAGVAATIPTPTISQCLNLLFGSRYSLFKHLKEHSLQDNILSSREVLSTVDATKIEDGDPSKVDVGESVSSSTNLSYGTSGSKLNLNELLGIMTEEV